MVDGQPAPAEGDQVFRYGSIPVTATEGIDYPLVSGTVTIKDGEFRSPSIRISTLGDELDEFDELFVLRFEADSNNTGQLEHGYLVYTISDNDPPAVVSIAGAAGTEGVGSLLFEVRLSGASGKPITVDYATADDTATAETDYVKRSGTVTFDPGEVVKTVGVPISDDDVTEADESFTVSLDNALNASIGDAVARGAIEDDDAVLSIADASASEADGQLEFVVTATGLRGDEVVTVRYETSNRTATAGTDYEAGSGTLTFRADGAKSVVVTVFDDLVDEPDEALAVTLSEPENAGLGDALAEGLIRDDDETSSEIALTVIPSEVSEGAGATSVAVTATLDGGARTEATTVTVSVAGTGDAARVDFEPVGDFEVVIPPNAVSGTATFTLTPEDDLLDEFDARLTISGVADLPVTAASLTLLDDDRSPTLTVAGGEAEEGSTVGFVVSLNGSTSRTVTVDYATADGTATAPEDYVSAMGTLSFAPGVLMLTVPVETADDTVHEPQETFQMALASPVNAALAKDVADGTILDDDEEPAALTTRPDDLLLCVGGDSVEIDLTRHFTGTALAFWVSSSDPAVATATLYANAVTVAAVLEGRTTVTARATGPSSEASFEITVTVVTDPMEVAAVETAFATIGRALLGEIVQGIGDRFGDADRTRVAGSSPIQMRQLAPFFTGTPTVSFGVPGDMDATAGLARPPRPAETTWPYANPPTGGPLPSDSRSIAFIGNTVEFIGAMTPWGRVSGRRFGGDGAVSNGSLSTLQLGADGRVADWRVGAATAFSRSEIDYRFDRSVENCGGSGSGEGGLETKLASVHPYVGRDLGNGWVWATIGVGRGDAVVARCASGRRTSTDLSMRMGAFGARQRLGGGDRVTVSMVEDLDVMSLRTATMAGPVGGHAVSVGRTRIGVEVGTLTDADRTDASTVTTWVRVSARHDWGDGVTGTGVELATGARLRAPRRRFGLDVGVHALALNATEDYAEYGMDLAASILPCSNGTGVRASLALLRGVPSDLDGWRDDAVELAQSRRAGGGAWSGNASFGYGFAAWRGFVQPFAEFDTSAHGLKEQAGVRYEFGDVHRTFFGEVSIGRHKRLRSTSGFLMVRGQARL